MRSLGFTLFAVLSLLLQACSVPYRGEAPAVEVTPTADKSFLAALAVAPMLHSANFKAETRRHTRRYGRRPNKPLSSAGLAAVWREAGPTLASELIGLPRSSRVARTRLSGLSPDPTESLPTSFRSSASDFKFRVKQGSQVGTIESLCCFCTNQEAGNFCTVTQIRK